MSGAKHRAKGDRIEREIVSRHTEIGVHAERYPLSGANRFRGSGHDLDIYARRDAAPLVAEVKARKSGKGFAQLERWLGDYDALFLRRNNADPMVLLPWRVWAALITDQRSKEFPTSDGGEACRRDPANRKDGE
jgi:Holliday junction resolvase